MPISRVVFSKRTIRRFESIADYIYKNTLSAEFTINYLAKIQAYIVSTLKLFPESGRLEPKYGKDVRKLVYQKYSILYRIKGDTILILTIFRENLP